MISASRQVSKLRMLDAIRNQEVPFAELPKLDGDWTTYPDRMEQFAASVAAVGGQAIECRDDSEMVEHLQKFPAFANGKRVFSDLLDPSIGNVDFEQIDDPHDLADLDFALFRGEFGVAENGAVWLDAKDLRHRVAYVIPQHLALVIAKDSIVNNMHEAYERIDFSAATFGMFMSGPSKTADIEQSLVIGAHGARSLTIFVVA